MSKGPIIFTPNGAVGNIPKKPTVDDEVKDWGLLIARYRKMKMTPLDAHKVLDGYVEMQQLRLKAERQQVEEIARKIL